MVRGGHGLLQVSLGPTMSNPCTTCGQTIREGKGAKGKRKGKGGGEGKGGRPQGERPAAILLPLWILHDVCLRGGREGKGEKGKRKGKEGESMGVW